MQRHPSELKQEFRSSWINFDQMLFHVAGSDLLVSKLRRTAPAELMNCAKDLCVAGAVRFETVENMTLGLVV
jgi:hypothetical protein